MKKHLLKIKVFSFMQVLYIILGMKSKLLAQGVLPCNGGDPTLDCPIDNLVYYFVAFMILIALYIKFSKKQNSFIKA